jgi:RecB family endonuclease NucS
MFLNIRKNVPRIRVLNSNKTSILENPDLKDALTIICDAISERRVIIIIGKCNVNYLGRAKSSLKDGERIVIIKADGSVLIHRPSGLEPVNYISSTTKRGISATTYRERKRIECLFETKIKRNTLSIKVVHKRSKERLTIDFTKIYMISASSLTDHGKFFLYASEEDMQKAILAYPNLIEDGFRPINYEKKVTPGFIDIYGVDSRGQFVVIEIKRKNADKSAVLQLAKYIKVIKGDRDEGIRGILVAPSIARGVQKLLASLNLEFKLLAPKKCAELIIKMKSEEKLEDYFDSS